MGKNEYPNKAGILITATYQERLYALIVLLLIAGVFAFLGVAASGIINLDILLGPCGFKQRFGLPCPTCGFTTAGIHFVKLNFAESFYAQPAAALFCSILTVSAFFAFITVVFGVCFRFVQRFFNEVKTGYLILAAGIIIAAGWLVTLSRALAQK